MPFQLYYILHKGVYTYMGMYGGGVCLRGGLILFGNGLQHAEVVFCWL